MEMPGRVVQAHVPLHVTGDHAAHSARCRGLFGVPVHFQVVVAAPLARGKAGARAAKSTLKGSARRRVQSHVFLHV